MIDILSTGIGVETDLIEVIKCMRYVLIRMSNALKDFSSKTEGPLRIHAVMASNRLKLMAEDLREGLTYAGVNPEVADFEEVREKFGDIPLNTMDKLQKSLEMLERGSDEPVKVGNLLKEFDDVLIIAINGFNAFNFILSELPDEKMKILGLVLRNTIDDLKLIKRRHDELAGL